MSPPTAFKRCFLESTVKRWKVSTLTEDLPSVALCALEVQMKHIGHIGHIGISLL